MADIPKPEELLQIDHSPPTQGLEKGWLRTAPDVEIKPGMHCFACEPRRLGSRSRPIGKAED